MICILLMTSKRLGCEILRSPPMLMLKDPVYIQPNHITEVISNMTYVCGSS